MRRLLLDTSSLSRLAPDRPKSPEVVRSVRIHSGALYLPTIAIAEVRTGIQKLYRIGAARKADTLREWLDRLFLGFGDRVLPFDLAAAERAGILSDAASATGRHPGFADVAVAAIAASRDLAVVTENRRHFEMFDMEILNLEELAGL